MTWPWRRRSAVELLGRWGTWRRRHAAAARVAPSGVRRLVRAAAGLVERALVAQAVPEVRRQVQEIAARHARPRATIVFLPALEWDLPLFQRPQQLALALAELGALVFYVEPAHAGPLVLTARAERLYVGPVPLRGLSVLDRPVAWTLCWNARHLEALTRPVVLYDHIDELSVFDHSARILAAAHARLVSTADVVLVTARRLEAALRPERPDLRLVPNGVDLEHFARARQPGPRPEEWQGVVTPGRPVIGYYGALARWFDYALVGQAASARPGYEFVLIGPDHDGTLRSSGLLAQPNVRWLGPVRYERLPEHVRAFDVATIPFVVDAVTHAVSPLKLFECMAAGRPIVITAMEESLRYPGPLVAHAAAELPARLDEALARRGDAVHQAELARVAAANTWRERAARVLATLDERRPAASH